MTLPSSLHPFDQALQLTPAGQNEPDTWLGATSPAYWNMVGPYGGTTAATAVQALTQHPDLLGEPVALTVNYASATVEGPFKIKATPVRTNRSTQHWVLSLTQTDAQGQTATVMTATAMTALRRDTWQTNDMPIPLVPAPQNIPRTHLKRSMEWLNRYDMRFVAGCVPEQWDGTGSGSLTQLWVRDEPQRPLDFASLTALSDVFYPRIWLRRATHVPAGTVSMTIYFHASKGQLLESGTGFLLAQAQAQTYRNGFFDQTAQLWSEAGTMLVSSTQLVYFKN